MATYVYQCSECLERLEEVWQIGTAPRRAQCECGHDMRLVIGVGVNVAHPDADTRAADAREDRWHKDMPAYYRMRSAGLQPKGIDGAAALEGTVGDQWDIEHKTFTDQGYTRTQVQDAEQRGAELQAEMLNRG